MALGAATTQLRETKPEQANTENRKRGGLGDFRGDGGQQIGRCPIVFGIVYGK